MSGSKGKDLLMADKAANSDEKSVDPFDSRHIYYETAEKLNRAFFYFNDRDLDGSTDSGDLTGNWIGRQREGAQVGTNYWFGACNHLKFKFRRQKVSQQHLQGGGALMDGGARIDYWVRFNLGLSESAQNRRLFGVIQTNAQRNVLTTVEFQ